ncbi:MAG: aminotransferase class V-fold PLP-dependent enzyme [Myxococcota bacterium]
MSEKSGYIEENLDSIRAEYDLLNYWVYLNVGDQMIPGNYWLKAVRDFFSFQERGRMDDIPVQDIATHPFLTTAYYEATELSAKLIHADPEEVTLAYRPMQVCNLVVNDLLSWKKGDNIVFTDLTYPSFPYVFQGVRDRDGVELRIVNNRNGEILMEDLERAIDGNTRLVAINRTTPFCGFTYDVKQVCDLAHAHGAYVLDDAFQAIGAIDVDVHADGVDFVVTGSYKWQCGPEGAGLFYVRKDLIPKLEPRFRNYLAVQMPRGLPFSLRDHDNVRDWDHPQNQTAEKFSLGSVTGPSVFGWLATLRFLDKLGMQNIERRVRRLGQYTVGALRDAGFEVRSPGDPAKMHGMITYTTGSEDRDKEVFQHLMAPPIGKRPVKISMRALGNVGGLRVCTHFFNTEAEVDYFMRLQSEFLAGKKK